MDIAKKYNPKNVFNINELESLIVSFAKPLKQ